MDKLGIIDELNKHKAKKCFFVDKCLKEDQYYVAYSGKGKNREYIRLADKGPKEIFFKGERTFPIFQGFVNDKTCVISISAARGTGKGIFCAAIADDYHKLNKSNNIFYVCSTSKDMDENLAKYKFVKDFDLSVLNNYKILDEKVDGEVDENSKDAGKLLDDFSDSLFIFDDVDELSKQVKNKINMLEKICISLGRKRNISVCIISHYETGGNSNRLLIKEVDFYITMNNDVLQTNRLLKEYRNVDLNQFDPSETYLIFNFDYNYVMSNKRIFFYKKAKGKKCL